MDTTVLCQQYPSILHLPKLAIDVLAGRPRQVADCLLRESRVPIRSGSRRGASTGDMTTARPLDRVNRPFRANRPDQLWVSDVMYASTGSAGNMLEHVLRMQMP